MHTRMRLGELLLASGLLSADQLEAALQGQRSSGMKLGEYLIKQGICRESDVVDAVCRQTGIERYTPSRFPLNLSLSDRLPADVAQRTNAVPLLIRGDVLVVAMMDPLDIDALDRIEIVTDREVEPVMCLRQEFTQLYAALYGHFNTMDGVMESFTALPDQPVASDDLLIASETPKDELGQPDEAPVVRLVNSILTQAVRESASDIHISPEKDSIQIRFRIDGKLRKTPSPPKSVGASIVSRIKILANMDISITRVPQDGRFTMMVDPPGNQRPRLHPADHLRRKRGHASARHEHQPRLHAGQARHERQGLQDHFPNDRKALRHDPVHRPHRERQEHKPLFHPPASQQAGRERHHA